jgi:hypothetical protein
MVDTKLSDPIAIESMPCSPRTRPFSAIAASAASARTASSGVRQNGAMTMTCSPSAHENREHADAGGGPPCFGPWHRRRLRSGAFGAAHVAG